jgi:hypothetical protein
MLPVDKLKKKIVLSGTNISQRTQDSGYNDLNSQGLNIGSLFMSG